MAIFQSESVAKQNYIVGIRISDSNAGVTPEGCALKTSFPATINTTLIHDSANWQADSLVEKDSSGLFVFKTASIGALKASSQFGLLTDIEAGIVFTTENSEMAEISTGDEKISEQTLTFSVKNISGKSSQSMAIQAMANAGNVDLIYYNIGTPSESYVIRNVKINPTEDLTSNARNGYAFEVKKKSGVAGKYYNPIAVVTS